MPKNYHTTPVSEIVSFYKYLGVQVEAKPAALYYKAYEKVIVKKAKKYLNLIRVKSKAFPDVGIVVPVVECSDPTIHSLWYMESTKVLPYIFCANNYSEVKARAGYLSCCW